MPSSGAFCLILLCFVAIAEVLTELLCSQYTSTECWELLEAVEREQDVPV